MELVTMEKLMNMELEIQELKRMNCDLKEKLSQRSDRKKKKKEIFRYKCDDALSSNISGEVHIFKSAKLRQKSAFYVSNLPKELRFPTDMSVYQETGHS